MWVRENANMTMYNEAGVVITSIPVGGFAFSDNVRVFGSKAVSFVFRGTGGGPLAEAGLLVSHAKSPIFPSAADWALGNTTGSGIGVTSSDVTAVGAVVNNGGLNVSGFPISSTTTPAPGHFIVTRWARLRLLNGSTAAIPIGSVSSRVVFDGDQCPAVVTSTGYVTKSVKRTYSGNAILGNDYIVANGCEATLKNGSLVAYTSGLPVVAGGGSLYVADVGVDHFHLVTKPGSTTYLLNPAAYNNKDIDIYNLELAPDAHTL
jgi:hypothetical protein